MKIKKPNRILCIELGLWLTQYFSCFAIAPFFTIEVINIKQGVVFDSLDEVYKYYDDVIKIVNLKQLLFYSDICRVQPDWLGRSIYDGRAIGYYGRERTKDCWQRWRRYEAEEAMK